MKNKKIINRLITDKARNRNSIRVIFKKVGQAPNVKIIDNILTLKKAIIKKQLTIIPYENLYIICNNKKRMEIMRTNIVSTFKSIKGDLILIDIDKKKREFKSISQEDIIWYSQDLINKSPNNVPKHSIKKHNKKKITEFYERGFEDNITSVNFEKTLINVLINIELVLASLLKNNKNGDMKNG